MNPIAATACLAFIGTAFAWGAGLAGFNRTGGLLLIAAAILITVAGYILQAEAYSKGVSDAETEDIYNDE